MPGRVQLWWSDTVDGQARRQIGRLLVQLRFNPTVSVLDIGNSTKYPPGRVSFISEWDEEADFPKTGSGLIMGMVAETTLARGRPASINGLSFLLLKNPSTTAFEIRFPNFAGKMAEVITEHAEGIVFTSISNPADDSMPAICPERTTTAAWSFNTQRRRLQNGS